MARRPTLPLGRAAPWALAAVALLLLAWGVVTSNREMLLVGAVAAGAWVVAFPVSRAFLGHPPHDDGESPAPDA